MDAALGGTIDEGLTINDNGQILCVATDANGANADLILTPGVTPALILEAALLMGSSMIGLLGLRRRKEA